MTTQENLCAVTRNGGWLMVEDQIGQTGYAPIAVFKPATRKPVNRPVQPVVQETPNVIPNVQPITNMYDEPLILPHTSMDGDKFKDDII